MNQQETTPGKLKQMMRSILIVFIGIAAGLFLFMLIATVINEVKGPLQPALNEYSKVLLIAITVISFTCLVAAKMLFNKLLTKAKDSVNSLQEKLNKYTAALILYMAICEGPGLLSVILFLMTGNFAFLVFACVLLGFILAMLPVRKKIAEQLALNWEEEQALE